MRRRELANAAWPAVAAAKELSALGGRGGKLHPPAAPPTPPRTEINRRATVNCRCCPPPCQVGFNGAVDPPHRLLTRFLYQRTIFSDLATRRKSRTNKERLDNNNTCFTGTVSGKGTAPSDICSTPLLLKNEKRQKII